MQKEIDNIISTLLSRKSGTDIKPNELLQIAKKILEGNYSDNIIHSFLEVGHFQTINTLYSSSVLLDEWLNTLFKLIDKSNFSTGFLLKQRADRYPNNILFQSIDNKKITNYSYIEVWQRVQQIGLSLLKEIEKSNQPTIGIYAPNSLEIALIDLACLSFNIKVVPIPANVSEEHLQYIINHSGITNLFIGGSEQVNLINKISSKLTDISFILLPNTFSKKIAYSTWINFLQDQSSMDIAELNKRMNSTKMDGDATIMYTSGTTANPKGIIFTQTNIITKRYARALALPDINTNDTFLCYLPLYHTFGRYFEMIGCIFWGATYTFAESPSFKSLLQNMHTVKPSIFISIPKRWFQLYELFTSDTSVDSSDLENVNNLISETTGGMLRIGLSAAGYLDSDIFTFFHKYNIQLLSGYGMTESTGGITMTPQNNYIRNSVGTALPGIQLMLAEDKELLLKGPYVTSYYHGKKKRSSLKNGWFHTGDIFEERNGHYFIVDRKKEIYKNSRGITISPQKIENLFQDFDSIKSIFLVGDGKPYNTVLIYPNHVWINSIENMQDFNLKEYYSSLLQSANSFLAPYERIVNYAIIDRDFSIKYGELTPKKTYKRKFILNNFAEYISPMYEKDYNSYLYKTNEVHIPKWLLRKSGIMANDLDWKGKYLSIRNTDKKLSLNFSNNNVQIGDFKFTNTNSYLDFNKLVVSPELWLGNQEFVDFFGFSAISPKYFEQPIEINLDLNEFKFNNNGIDNIIIADLKHALLNKSYDLIHVHKAATILFNESDYNLSIAINYLSKILLYDDQDLVEFAITLLTRLRYHPICKIRVKALEVLTPNINGKLFIELLSEIYNTSEDLSSLKDITLDIRVIKNEQFQFILNKSAYFRNDPHLLTIQQTTFIKALLSTIIDYGIAHPTVYRWARSELIKWTLSSTAMKEIITYSIDGLNKLTIGFRKWLGPNRLIAIDQDSGEEYSWEEAIIFDPNIEEKYKETLLNAISKTQLLKEAIFLLSNSQIVHLDSIQLRGVWVLFLGSNHGKSVFRVTVQTRDHMNHNFVINLNETQTNNFLQDEIRLLITTGSSSRGWKLVEDFGGYWPEYNIFTEEYVHGETLYQYFERNRNQISQRTNNDLWQMRWLHFIWNGVMAYFSFYRRSNYKYYIERSSINNLIIPEHDYAIGTRLISISDRALSENITSIFISIYRDFIIDTEVRYKGLKHVADWVTVFYAFLQTVTVKKGIEILKILIAEIENGVLITETKKYKLTKAKIQKFISKVDENGVLTKPVVFASLRYERWLAINTDATLEARGTMIKQLYNDYMLGNLINDYPETRIRFFIMTAFKDSEQPIRNELLQLQKGLRAKTILALELDEYINNINKILQLTPDDEYFITRLIFEHIDAEDKGKEFVWDAGLEGKLELITAITDNFGENHQMRQPVHPKEIAKFQTLLLNSNLGTVFNQQHEFLFILNSANQLIGGVYWNKINDTTAYLERIVVIPKYRKRHLSSLLLDELFNRLKNKRFTHITVGFFQAGLFYNKGFYIDKQFGGLVKKLI